MLGEMWWGALALAVVFLTSVAWLRRCCRQLEIGSSDAGRARGPAQAGRNSAVAKPRSFHVAPRKLDIVVITLSRRGLQSGTAYGLDKIYYSMMLPRTLTLYTWGTPSAVRLSIFRSTGYWVPPAVCTNNDSPMIWVAKLFIWCLYLAKNASISHELHYCPLNFPKCPLI